MSLSKIPVDVLVLIMSQLSIPEIGSLIRVEKCIYDRISQSDYFWKVLYFYFHRVIPSNVQSWSVLFRTRHTRWYPLESEMFEEADHNTFISRSNKYQGFCLEYVMDRGFLADNRCGNWQMRSHTLQPIPLNVGGSKVLYYEVIVSDEPVLSGNGVGLLLSGISLNNHMPGWEKGSYAIHSDNGNAYYNNESTIYQCKGFAYAPAFQRNNAVIGCGYNFKTKEIFFTIDGQFIGVAFNLPDEVPVGDIAPCIGMLSKNSYYTVNLGHFPFVFNIDAYICGDNVEKLENVILDETDSSSYRMYRKDIEEMLKRGENFLTSLNK